MSWLLSILIIFAGISTIIKPEVMVNQKNQNYIKKGKPPISEADMPKHISQARMFGIFVLICGLVVLASDIMMSFS